MGIKTFFKNAFADMKANAKAQHEVDKANMAATKAESRAQWEEAKAMGDPARRKQSKRRRYSPFKFSFITKRNHRAEPWQLYLR